MELEFMKLFTRVSDLEFHKNNLDKSVYFNAVPELTAKFDENFAAPYYRCAFLYRYATIITLFVKECFDVFFSSSGNTVDVDELVSSWKDGNICSFTTGPGLDYISFMSSFEERTTVPLDFKNVYVVSKTGAWRNTVCFMKTVQGDYLNTLLSAVSNIGNVKVVEKDLFKQVPVEHVSESRVVLMVKTVNMGVVPEIDNEESIFECLKDIIGNMRDGSTLFCIDTKPSIVLMLKVLGYFHGKFIFSSDQISYRLPMQHPPPKDVFQNSLHLHLIDQNILPKFKMRGYFIIWQKKHFHILSLQNVSLPSSRLDSSESSEIFENTALSSQAFPDLRNGVINSKLSNTSLSGNTKFGIEQVLQHRIQHNASVQYDPNKLSMNEDSNKIDEGGSDYHGMKFESESKPSVYQQSRSLQRLVSVNETTDFDSAEASESQISDDIKNNQASGKDESRLIKELTTKVEELVTFLEKSIDATTLEKDCSTSKYNFHDCEICNNQQGCSYTGMEKGCNAFYGCCTGLPYKGCCCLQARQNANHCGSTCYMNQVVNCHKRVVNSNKNYSTCCKGQCCLNSLPCQVENEKPKQLDGKCEQRQISSNKPHLVIPLAGLKDDVLLKLLEISKK